MKLLRNLIDGTALGLLLAINPASAQVVSSDQVVVTLSPPAVPTLLPPFIFTFNEAVEVPLFLPLGLPTIIGTFPPLLIVLEEPANEGGGISDMLLVNTLPSPFCAVQLCFVSDDDQAALTGLLDSVLAFFGNSLVTTTLPETGALQDVTPLGLQSIGVTLQIRSDVTSVPEPATLLLLALGLFGLGFARRKLA